MTLYDRIKLGFGDGWEAPTIMGKTAPRDLDHSDLGMFWLSKEDKSVWVLIDYDACGNAQWVQIEEKK